METDRRRNNLCAECKTDSKNSAEKCWFEQSVITLDKTAKSEAKSGKASSLSPKDRLSKLSQSAHRKQCVYIPRVLSKFGPQINPNFRSGIIIIGAYSSNQPKDQVGAYYIDSNRPRNNH